MIRVVIADDQQLIRQALRLLFEHSGEIEVVGEASNGNEAIAVVQQTNPDVLVMDISMPQLNGIDATRKIKELNHPVRVLILSMYADEHNVRKAVYSGASGYALKGALPKELLEAVYQLSQRKPFISAQVESAAEVIMEINADRAKTC